MVLNRYEDPLHILRIIPAPKPYKISPSFDSYLEPHLLMHSFANKTPTPSRYTRQSKMSGSFFYSRKRFHIRCHIIWLKTSV